MAWQLLDISLLRKVHLFHRVSDEALTDLLTITHTSRPEASTLIFSEGDPGDALYVILDGEVRISKDIPGIGEEALAFLSAGSYFGEMALLDKDAERSANAIAGTDCHLGIIPRDDFLELMSTNHEMASEILWSFVATLSDRLRASNEKIAFFALSNMFE